MIMRKFWNFLTKINFSLSAIIVIGLAILLGRFKPLFIHLFIAFIHEMGHITAALLFRKKVKQINVLPFGFNAEIEDLEYSSPWQEMIIMLAGPITYFLSNALIYLFYRVGSLSLQSFNQANDANLVILLFNLLPIWPLDGSHILKCILEYFFTLKIVNYLLIFTSIVFTIGLVMYMGSNPQLMIIAFLLFSQISFLLTMEVRRLKFLTYRLGITCHYPVRIHQKHDIYWPYDNVYLSPSEFYNESELIIKLMSRGNGQKKSRKMLENI